MSKILSSRPEYRVVTAPVKKVFHVDVGTMDPAKARQYLADIKAEIEAPCGCGCEDGADIDALNAELSLGRLRDKLNGWMLDLIFEPVNNIEQRVKDFLAGNPEILDYAVVVQDHDDRTNVDICVKFTAGVEFVYIPLMIARQGVRFENAVDIELPLDDDQVKLAPYLILEALEVASCIVNAVPSRAEQSDNPTLARLGEYVNHKCGNVNGYHAIEDALEHMRVYVASLPADTREEPAEDEVLCDEA